MTPWKWALLLSSLSSLAACGKLDNIFKGPKKDPPTADFTAADALGEWHQGCARTDELQQTLSVQRDLTIADDGTFTRHDRYFSSLDCTKLAFEATMTGSFAVGDVVKDDTRDAAIVIATHEVTVRDALINQTMNILQYCAISDWVVGATRSIPEVATCRRFSNMGWGDEVNAVHMPAESGERRLKLTRVTGSSESLAFADEWSRAVVTPEALPQQADPVCEFVEVPGHVAMKSIDEKNPRDDASVFITYVFTPDDPNGLSVIPSTTPMTEMPVAAIDWPRACVDATKMTTTTTVPAKLRWLKKGEVRCTMLRIQADSLNPEVCRRLF